MLWSTSDWCKIWQVVTGKLWSQVCKTILLPAPSSGTQDWACLYWFEICSPHFLGGTSIHAPLSPSAPFTSYLQSVSACVTFLFRLFIWFLCCGLLYCCERISHFTTFLHLFLLLAEPFPLPWSLYSPAPSGSIFITEHHFSCSLFPVSLGICYFTIIFSYIQHIRKLLWGKIWTTSGRSGIPIWWLCCLIL